MNVAPMRNPLEAAVDVPALPVVDPRSTASLSLPEVERALLFAAIHLGVAQEVAELLRPEHLHSEPLATVLTAVRDLLDAHETITEQTVAGWLRTRQKLEGCRPALLELRGATCDTAALSTLARQVIDLADLRRTADACRRALAICLSSANDPASAREMALKAVADAGEQTTKGVEIVQMFDVGQQRRKEWADARDGKVPRVQSLPTGFHAFDRMTGGLRIKATSFFMADSGHGKTTFVDNIVAFVTGKHWNHERVATVVIAGEMEPEETWDRMICARAGVSERTLARIMQHAPDYDDEAPIDQHDRDAIMARIGDAMEYLESIPLFIYPSTADLNDIRRALRDAQRRCDENRGEGSPRSVVRYVVVDYAQMMRLPKAERHDLALGAFSNGCKEIAREFACHVSLTSQVSGDEIKHSKDLKNAAHSVWQIRRPAKSMDPDDPRRADFEHYAELIARKGRNHGDGLIPLYFDGEKYLFRDPNPGELDHCRKHRASMHQGGGEDGYRAPRRRGPHGPGTQNWGTR